MEDILILERDTVLGGILNQCIHNGFGLHTFKEELTGPEYAYRFIRQVEEAGIPCLTDTMVVDLEEEEGEKYITAMNRKDGILTIRTKAIILAMGCRERPRGALNIPGFRPAGVYSAGTAQRLVNIEGKMPGRDVVILGSGDIGLIMARRMTLEGAKVHTVAEIMPYSGGLKRNIVQCLDDFGIPLKLSTTVVKIHGKERMEGVTLAKVDERMKPIPGTEEYIPCDTLLLSVGLLPENELTEELGAKMSPVTRGPLVNESMETSLSGVFACGNVLHVHDLVDFVSQEAALAGKAAAEWLKDLFGLNPMEFTSFGDTFLDKIGKFDSPASSIGTVANWAGKLVDSFVKNAEEFAGNWCARFWEETFTEAGIKLVEGAAVSAGVSAAVAGICTAVGVACPPALVVGVVAAGATMLLDWGLDSLVSWATGGSETSWIEHVSDRICDGIDAIRETVGPAVEKAGQVINDGIDAVVDTGRKVVDSVKDGISNIFSGRWLPCLAN